MSLLKRLFGVEREEHLTMDREVATKLANAKRAEAEAIEQLAKHATQVNSDHLLQLAKMRYGEAAVYESYYEQEEFEAIIEEGD
jgi:hypothetical protein